MSNKKKVHMTPEGETQPLVGGIQDQSTMSKGGSSSNLLWPPRAPGLVESRSASFASAKSGWRGRLSTKSNLETWQFPGWGEYDMELSVTEEELDRIATEIDSGVPPLLNEFEATAICSNDILSSCLYVVGLVYSAAGKITPLCLLIVACVLYFFRGMYGEAITALPMNGGSYNVLINTTSKGVASFAATLALVSYLATGVVSATSAIAYLQKVISIGHPILATILLLLFFAVLVALGIKESAVVAETILVVHIATLTCLAVLSIIYVISDTSTLIANLDTPYPDVSINGIIRDGGFFTALFLGYTHSILGVSGYESSSQYVQSQAPGVFIKTLKWMHIGVLIVNPLISFLALGVLDMDILLSNEYTVLARMGTTVGDWIHPGTGLWLKTLISLDAVFVLSGALLTAYVGVNGLIERMASDRCLPQFLLNKNKWRRTTHNIIFGYFFLASALVVILEGDVADLSGVYNFAFLSVLTAFSIGVMLLKFKRPSLPREVRVPWWQVISATTMIFIGLLGTLMGRAEVLSVFTLYVAAAGALVLSMFQRTRFLQFLLHASRSICPFFNTTLLKEEIIQTQLPPAVFFCKRDDVYVINKALLYVVNNEQTSHLIVVHCYDQEHPPPAELKKHLEMIDEMYPKIKVTFAQVQAHFGPAFIEWLSREYKIPKNSMFITAPDSDFKYKLDKLGGARVITH